MTENLEPEKLELATVDIGADKQAELLRLFPEARTEGGKIDFDRLRLALGETVDVGKERYGMNWPGKADCFKSIQRPSLGTLLPVREESVNFDETENLIIEGDNLEVLKLLQKSYQGKVKMIYIDPPYNTGKDFIYPDNYSESLQTYLEYTGQVDSEGRKFSNNAETDGRFHTKWLNMMYPRLYMARNLLRADGAIFVSIDDHELVNLVRILDDVFGEENRLASVSVVSNLKGRSDDKHFATSHNYLLVYGNAEFESAGVPLPDDYLDDYPNTAPDGRRFRLQGLRKRGAGARRVDRPNLFFPLYVDSSTKAVSTVKTDVFTEEVLPRLSSGEDGRWRWGRETAAGSLEDLVGEQVGPEKRWDVFQVDYCENQDGVKRIKPKTIWLGSEFSNEAGNLEVKKLFGKSVFDTAKPTRLISYCLEQATSKDDLVLDFFAGAGTTAHAVLDMNMEDNGNRRFILVQLPEPTEREDFKTIAEITKERVRLVIHRHEKESEGKLDLGSQPNEGFRVLKLATSNFNVWSANTETTTTDGLTQQLDLHIDHIQPNRTSEDLLYEILLKSGFPLTTPVQTITIEGIAVYSVANGAMLICLDKSLTHEAIKGMAELRPQRVVCLDEGFAGNDQLKTNAVLIMKAKGVTKFQTV